MRGIASVLSLCPLCVAQTGPPPNQEVRAWSREYVPITLQAKSTLVQADVVVRNASGRTVSGLQQRQFRLFEEGKEREIAGFSVVTAAAPAPAGGPDSPAMQDKARREASAQSKGPARFIALYFDDFNTPSEDLARCKRAAKRFVQDGAGPDSRMAVFNASGGAIAEFTAVKAKVVAAIDRVQAHPKFSSSGLAACSRITPYDAYLIANRLGNDVLSAKVFEARSCGVPTAQAIPGMIDISDRQVDPNIQLVISQAEQTWDQVKLASQATLDAISRSINALSAAPGDRLLLLVSSGFLTGTLEREQDRLATKAVRARIVISALDAKGLFIENPGRPFGEDPISRFAPPQVALWEEMSKVDSKEVPTRVMAELAEATGGLFFHRSNDYSLGFLELGAVPETAYLIAFQPADLPDGKYHKLRIQVAASGTYSIQARPGYFAEANRDSASIEDSRRADLDREVTSLDTVQGLPAEVGIRYGAKLASGQTPVRVQTHLDVKRLRFPERDGRRIQKLTIVVALLDEGGNIVSAREGGLDFAMGQAKYQSTLDSGVNLVMSLAAPHGAYTLRTVAMEGVDGQMAALTYAVNVP